ncbi:MAG: choice-of-anchor B family protein [Acidobacteriota bacterium]
MRLLATICLVAAGTIATPSWGAVPAQDGPQDLQPIVGGELECVDGHAGIFECDNIDLVSFLPVRAIGGGPRIGTNDVWGWSDPETDHDYALVGLHDRTSFVDVTDVQRPVWVGSLERTNGARRTLWRDIKVYDNYAYIVSDNAGRHGVQVFDLTELRRFAGEPLDFHEFAHYDGVASAHNIVIDQGEPFAYVVGANGSSNDCGGGLHILNIEDPRNPVFVGCFADTRTGRRGTGYTHDAMCVRYQGPDEAYRGHEICFAANETGLSIADLTDKRNPVALGLGEYPNTAYTHQGWISDDHTHFYVNDEGDEVAGLTRGTRTLIFDVSRLDDPVLVAQYITDSPATDHNLYVRGDLMYQSNYRSGLRVYDVSDAERMRAVGYFDTVPWGGNEGMGNLSTGALGSWSNYPFFDSGVVVVTSGLEGVFILRIHDATR